MALRLCIWPWLPTTLHASVSHMRLACAMCHASMKSSADIAYRCRWGVLPKNKEPDTAIINVYDVEDCIPPHIDHHDFDRPFCTISLLSQQNIMFGNRIISRGPADFQADYEMPLPTGQLTGQFRGRICITVQGITRCISLCWVLQLALMQQAIHVAMRSAINTASKSHIASPAPCMRHLHLTVYLLMGWWPSPIAVAQYLVIVLCTCVAGSCLVLKGNGADVAQHCVPPVSTRRMSITLRRYTPVPTTLHC